jgi:uncharacterized repeat protein (TIGR01451 family)
MIIEVMIKFIRIRVGKVLAGAFIIILSPIILDLMPGLTTSFPQTSPSRVELGLRDSGAYFPAQVVARSESKENLRPLSQNADFVVYYRDTDSCSTSGLPDLMPDGTPTSWSSEARDAFEHAVSIWALLLNTNHTIVINACWLELSSSEPLGMAQPISAYANFSGALTSDTLYPVALANELAGTDLNDIDGSDHDGDGNDTDVEIIIVFNSHNNIDWYFGTDGNPPSGHFDFVTTALHEIGHGLGFVSTLFVDTGDNRCNTNNDGDGCWGIEQGGQDLPAIYDRFVENGSGQSLIDTQVFTNPSTALGNALTGAVFFNGPNAKSGNNNNPPELYAPDPFELSSSILHLDNNTFNDTHNQLMTPIINNPQHHPGPVALGMLRDMGWNVAELPPVSLTQSASSNLVTPGQILTYTLIVTNTGYVKVTDVIVTDTVPSGTALNVGSLSGDVTTSGTTAGSVITWTTGISLTTGKALSRTFAVTVDFGLAGQSTITNTAGVTSTAGVGAHATLYTNVVHNTYLPIILLEKD